MRGGGGVVVVWLKSGTTCKMPGIVVLCGDILVNTRYMMPNCYTDFLTLLLIIHVLFTSQVGTFIFSLNFNKLDISIYLIPYRASMNKSLLL